MQADWPHNAQWLTFRLHGGEYALPVAGVVEVLRMAALARIPEAPGWLAGMLNLRGQVIPVIDLRARLGLPARPVGLETPIIVAHAGMRSVGFIADEVSGVLTLSPQALAHPDDLAGVDHPIATVARVEGRLVLLLDHERICDRARDFASWSERAAETEPEPETVTP